MVVILDIGNVFNSAWPDRILRMARKRELPEGLCRAVEGFLRDRVLVSGSMEYNLIAGCPQGSSLDPTLWLLIMEDLFDNMQDTSDRRVQAYADDIVITINGASVKKVERIWKQTWEGLE